MSEQSERLKPFIKWAGGKGALVPKLLAQLPGRWDCYHEPFLGSGALFFALAGAGRLGGGATLSDVNEEMINLYRCVQSDLESLLPALEGHKHDRDYYYRLRRVDREPGYKESAPLERASRFLYLNKTCYNGLYRVNASGYFNVPFGDYKHPRIADAEHLRRCSAALQGVDLRIDSFETIAERAVAGDFVYLDPPYVPTSDTANFTSYTSGGFGMSEQECLVDVCRKLTSRGVHFLLSNSDTETARALYGEFLFSTVEAPRAINSKASGRGKVSELLIRNYEPPVAGDRFPAAEHDSMLEQRQQGEAGA